MMKTTKIGRRSILKGATASAADWGLLLFTDGLFEGRADPATSERWGVDGLTGHLRALLEAGTSHDDIVATLVAEAERRNGGPLTDDVAAVLVGRRDRWT
jgi:serine phosphatase RsbU (regulator of sigma subunit)